MSTCLCSASAEAVFSLIVSISDRRELAFDSLSGYTEALAEFIEIGIIISELGIYVAQKNSGIVWNFHNNLREKMMQLSKCAVVWKAAADMLYILRCSAGSL